MADTDVVIIISYCIVFKRFINQVSELLEKALNCRNINRILFI